MRKRLKTAYFSPTLKMLKCIVATNKFLFYTNIYFTLFLILGLNDILIICHIGLKIAFILFLSEFYSFGDSLYIFVLKSSLKRLEMI